MAIFKEQMIGDAVHIRSWIMKLNRGDRLNVIPGSQDHATLLHLLDYVEREMMRRRSQLATVRDTRKADTKPRCLYIRERRVAKSQMIREQIDKYFKIHGEPDGRQDDPVPAPAVPEGT